jgi:thiol-disulfide isomerase/thioredoxin
MRTGIAFLLATTAVFAAEVGRPSPPFSIIRKSAPSRALSHYKGKVVALAFISTGCSHCQELTKVLNRIAADYASRGVQIVACAFNDDAAQSMTEFQERFKPAFPVGWNNRMAVMSYLGYSIVDSRPLYVPHMVFLDRSGIVRADYAGESAFFQNSDANIRGELDKLLKANAAPPSRR